MGGLCDLCPFGEGCETRANDREDGQWRTCECLKKAENPNAYAVACLSDENKGWFWGQVSACRDKHGELRDIFDFISSRYGDPQEDEVIVVSKEKTRARKKRTEQPRRKKFLRQLFENSELTSFQKRVLHLLCQGKKTKEIAEALAVPDSTVSQCLHGQPRRDKNGALRRQGGLLKKLRKLAVEQGIG